MIIIFIIPKYVTKSPQPKMKRDTPEIRIVSVAEKKLPMVIL